MTVSFLMALLKHPSSQVSPLLINLLVCHCKATCCLLIYSIHFQKSPLYFTRLTLWVDCHLGQGIEIPTVPWIGLVTRIRLLDTAVDMAVDTAVEVAVETPEEVHALLGMDMVEVVDMAGANFLRRLEANFLHRLEASFLRPMEAKVAVVEEAGEAVEEVLPPVLWELYFLSPMQEMVGDGLRAL